MELRVCTSCRKVVPGATTCPGCHQALTLADPEFFVGHEFGKYRLERVLGTGGMGAVYLATHRTLERPAAVKLVLPQHRDPHFRSRFLREARLMAELSHPNVVEIFDYDVGEWDTPYYVMEYLRGSSLRDLLSRHGRLPPATLAAVLRDVAAGLGAAHRRGIVHRDLKPENLFVADFDGRSVTKVLDFGIAKAVGRDTEESRLTRTGTVVGTLHYLAPEQILGDPVSPATDQFALALVVAELVTGRTVRFGKTLGEIISDEIRRPLELPPEIAAGLPEPVRTAVRRATSPAPVDRFPDVGSFVAALLQGLGAELTLDSGRTVLHPGTETAERSAPSPRPPRLSARAAMIAGGVLLAAVAITGLWLLGPSSGGRADQGLAPLSAAVVAELQIPPDASSLVAGGRDRVVLGGADGMILVPLDGGEPTRLAIDPRQTLGSTAEGALLLRQDGGVVIRDLTEPEAMPWIAELPLTGRLLASPSARQLAAHREQQLEVVTLEGDRYRPAFSVAVADGTPIVAVGERLVAVVDRRRLRVWSLPEGRLELERPLDEGRITALAIHDAGDLVAIGGWADEITVLRAGDGATFTTRRRPLHADRLALEFLPDGTLAIAEPGGLTLWNPGDGRRAEWQREGVDLADVGYAGGRLLVVDRGRRRLVTIAFAELGLGRSLGPGGAEIWTLAADPDGARVFAGASDGELHAVDLASGQTTRHELHSLGITSLVASGSRLASSSDDRTIAVWRLPELSVEWRSRAHSFLVNQLQLDASGQSLWSSSSDGSLKRWSWPELELEETVDVAELLGRRFALHAVWPSPDGRTLLLGTWNRALLVLERSDDGPWQGRVEPVEAFGGYGFVALPGVDAVALVGVQHPYGLYAYDLSRRALLRLPDERVAATWAVAAGDARLLAFGLGAIADLRFRRDDAGDLRTTFDAVLETRLGTAGAAVGLSGGRVAVANDVGEVFVVDLARLAADG